MMRMMGLGTTAYWVINYIFWFLMYATFSIIFVFFGSIVKLPSGYQLGLFIRQDYRRVQNMLTFSYCSKG